MWTCRRSRRTGKFRADLLDRLAFDVITLPPLRERPDDIDVVAEHMALGMTKELKREVFAGFSAEALAALRAHPWPGNVRELRNVVERAVYRTDPAVPIEDIVFDPFASPWRPAGASEPAAPAVASAAPPPAAPAAADPGKPYDLVDFIRGVEHDHLKRALEINAHHQKKTADHLGMTYHQLRNYLRKHRLIGR